MTFGGEGVIGHDPSKLYCQIQYIIPVFNTIPTRLLTLRGGGAGVVWLGVKC